MIKHLIYHSIIQIILLTTTQAGGLDNFLKFTQRGGSLTSINKGTVIQDQRSGYFTGGSIISRSPKPMELQPVSIQLPSFALDGCTGSFDMRWGGFSYIKSREFLEFFKGVAASTPAYVAKMAIKSVCPQCEDIMSYLETVARDINGITFSQCEQSKKIADGLFSKLNAVGQQKCMSRSSLVRGGRDLVESIQRCQDNPDRYGTSGDDRELKSMLPDNYNLVWKALSHGDGKAPTQMKELMMSISGSIMGTKSSGVSTVSSLASLVERDDLLEQYIGKPTGSSEVKLYVCDETSKCLYPKIITKTLSSRTDTLYGKIEQTLQSILTKIYNNKGTLSDEEQELIEYSQIPLISLFEIELSLKNKNTVASFAGDAEFIEVICYDMVVNFMSKMLLEAKDAVDQIKTSQLDNTPIERFNSNVERIQTLLKDKKYLAMKKLQTIISVKERLAQQQSVFELNFSRFIER